MTDTPFQPAPGAFPQLVMMLATSAMQHLGKLVHPETGHTDVDLDAAQFSIDLLEMLAAKTRGNPEPAEIRLLNETLTALRLNYVETAQAEDAKKSAPPPAASTTPPPAAETPPKTATPPTEDEDDKRRFHKSYG